MKISFLKNAVKSSYKEKTIPGLDGVRAVSILLVILGHSAFIYDEYLPSVALYFINMQSAGVTIFFTLSGFLINLLLIKEKERVGHINYKLFYTKRLFRIFPSFYLYILFIFMFTTMFSTAPTLIEVGSALTFTWNYVHSTANWLLGHSWSLSVEEQFYLTWPILIGLLYLRNSKKLALILIAVSPLVRITCYYLFPEWRGRISIMLHTRVDSLMIGCLLSYYYYEGRGLPIKETIQKYKLHWLAVTQLFILSPILRIYLKGKYTLTLGYSMEGISIITLIVMIIYLDEKSWIYKILNSKTLRHIGILSYGLYLWQQFFLSHDIHFASPAIRFLLLYLTALLINLLLEYPLSVVSRSFQKKINTN